MSAIALFLLSSLGIAMTVQAQDCSRPQGGPNMDLKGDDINLQSFPDGTRVTFTCNVGYRSVGGSPSINCTAGTWSPVRLTCEKKNCGPASDVDNGHVDYPDGTEFGAKVVVICRNGYRLVGRADLICGDQGWMGRLPSCEVTTCYPPPEVPDATFSPSKEYYGFREVIQYSCPKDLDLVGSNLVTCSEDGTFKPDPPACIKVECSDPVSPLSNLEWAGGSRPPYRYRSAVTLQCKSGYGYKDTKGQVTVTCKLNKEWSPELPVCERIVPPTKPTTPSTTTTIPSGTQRPKDDGSNLGQTVGIVFGVLIFLGIIIFCGCYCFGVPVCFKKMRGHRRGNSDTEAPHDGEDVALS